jgi:hypothetical protein
MKVKSVEIINAITIPGTSVLGAISIFPEKHPDVSLSLESNGVLVESRGISAIIPLTNIKSVILAPEVQSGRSKQTAQKS